MPNPKTVTLHASGAETGSGTGTAVDVENRTYSEITLDVTALTGSSTLTLTVESSPTLSSWTTLAHFQGPTVLGVKTLIIPDGFKWLRAKWVVSGSVTFTVTAEAHQLYAKPKDVFETGIADSALAGISMAEIAKACLKASSEAEGYLGASGTLPITTLDAATVDHIANMALFQTFKFRAKTSAATQSTLEIGQSQALTWLNRIATGKLRPAGLVDATPETQETGSPTDLYVVGGPSRRW